MRPRLPNIHLEYNHKMYTTAMPTPVHQYAEMHDHKNIFVSGGATK
jgi:hypothetical protein